ncbi:MAG: sodium-dependent transporter, partial [Emcibacteraceae bacterium]|nr:sodium-dependent transporter [Emcibacteraceae bacterium]
MADTSANIDKAWSSQLTYIFAAVGSAVGVANIWRFSYVVGENGGGAFVFIYLAAVLLLASPILIAELIVGRRGNASPPVAIYNVAKEAGASSRWRFMGFVGVIVSIVVFSIYSIVGGWTLAYSIKAATGYFMEQDPEAIQNFFGSLTSDVSVIFGWSSLFLLATVWISSNGIKGGIEKAVKILMPLLFLMLIVLVIYAAIFGDFAHTIEYLFTPDFSSVNSNIIIQAFGQAFFSLGVGVTNAMAYGAYISRQTSLPQTSLMIAGADTMIALLAGLIIFPIIFAFNIEPSEGTGLAFIALPIAFSGMTGGLIFGTIFFLLLFFAALTSSISMMESSVSWIEDKTGWSRKKSAYVSGALSWVLSVLSVLSFGVLSGFYPLDFIGVFEGKTFFGIFDYTISSIMMPLGGIFIAIFVGWAKPV